MADSYFNSASFARKALRTFNPPMASADSLVEPERETLAARARASIENHNLTAAMLDRLVKNACGTGLIPHISIENEYIGLTEKEAQVLISEILRLWNDYAQTEFFSFDRNKTFRGQLSSIAYAAASQGDVFVLRRMTRQGKWKSQWQPIHGGRVCNPGNTVDTTNIVGGIERDKEGRPSKVWIRGSLPGDYPQQNNSQNWQSVKIFGENSETRNVLHVMNPAKDIGQTRGIPFISGQIIDALQSQRYQDAELMRAIIQSMQVHTITSPVPEAITFTAEQQDLISKDGYEAYRNSLYDGRDIALEEGRINILPAGDVMNNPAATSPNTAFEGFISSLYANAGAAVGIPGEVVRMLHPSSYSASRAALNAAWVTFLFWRYFALIEPYCIPVFLQFITECLANGYINLPKKKGFEPTDFNSWLSVEWIGPYQIPIDEESAANAAAKRIEAGLSTRKRESLRVGHRYDDDAIQRAWEQQIEPKPDKNV